MYYDVMDDECGYYLEKNEVLEVVEEMTKEFPLEVVKVKGEAGFHYLEEREAMKKLGELVLWFVKWLMESTGKVKVAEK